MTMRAIWETLERFDQAVFKSLDQVDQLLKRRPLWERTQEKTKDVREPQRVITFDQ